jgi:Flp pilus assembly protein TadG
MKAGKRSRSRGQSLVEFALISPVLLLLLVGVLDLGRAFYIQTALQNAAREGTRYGSVHPTWVVASDQADPNNLTYRINTEAGATVPASALTTTVSCTDGSGATYAAGTGGYMSCVQSGNRLTVSTTFAFKALTPLISIFLPAGGLQLSGSSTITIE